MVFSSHIFLFYFLPLFLVVYYALPFTWRGFYLRNTWITLTSFVFYGWLMPWYIVPMLFSIIKNYICGDIIAKPGQIQWKRKVALWVAILGDISLLAVFKYTPLVLQGVDKLSLLFGTGTSYYHLWNIVLPAGISFYTFVAISYTVDLYRGDAKASPNFPAFTCFIALFPHLIAGPIIRYNSVAEMLAKRSHTLEKFTSGLAIFMLGFGKKILLANSAGQVADIVFRANNLDPASAWWGILGYHFQLYFDFCAYSDMAVGLARMMGIEFIKNFNSPYHSLSLTDFWRRWHISLGSFIRDYLYIPLGGNRRGTGRTYFNLGLAFFLCGLWHGAKMTFIVWGTFQGVFMIFDRLRGKRTTGIFHGLPIIVQIILCNIIVMFSWALFRAPSIHQGVIYWGSMLGLVHPAATSPLLHAEIFTTKHIIELLICAVFVWQPVQAHEFVNKLSMSKLIVIFLVFLLAICAMFTQTYNPFLYFQF